jgi:hypothetical protein
VSQPPFDRYPPPAQWVGRVQAGVLLDSPLVPGWGSTPWTGVVWPDARAPGGWARTVLPAGRHGRGHAAADLTPGDVVEFGADERRPAGRKRWEHLPRRWYGVVLATDRDRLVAWGPFPTPSPAWDVAQAALSHWRQAAHVTIPGVTDTAPPPVAAPGARRPELQPAKPVVEVRSTGATTRVDDPIHGTMVVDAARFGAGMATTVDHLVEGLRRAAPEVALTGREPHASLAALTALHPAADPPVVTATAGPAYHASPDGSVEVRDARGATARPVRPPRQWTPDGFGWGYDGDGPTELAYALLADATGSPPTALRLAARYATDVTARLPAGQAWSLAVGDVRAWAAAAEHDVAPRATQPPLRPPRGDGGAEVGL